jgi:hypothetical protein
MTNFGDIISQGGATYNRVQMPTGGSARDTENMGAVVTPIFAYIPTSASGGAPATALPSGIVASQQATGGGTLSMSGSLVSGGVATLDVPRGIAISSTATTTLATCVFTLRGTDFYGAPMTWSGIGPGIAATVLSNQCFKTITTASVVGLVTANTSIGTSDVYDVPYRIPNAGFIASMAFGGADATASTASGAAAVITAGQLPTFVMTASASGPRGTVQLPTGNLANGTTFFTILQVNPIFSATTPRNMIVPGNDTTANTYGPLPFSN